VLNFFSKSFYKEELAPGGCLKTFVNSTEDALNPLSPSMASDAGAATMAASTVMRYNAAQAYAAARTNVLGGKGLIFPQKSMPYNNIMEGSTAANLDEGGLGYLDGQLVQHAQEARQIVVGVVRRDAVRARHLRAARQRVVAEPERPGAEGRRRRERCEAVQRVVRVGRRARSLPEDSASVEQG
jgi:hypothetical protein